MNTLVNTFATEMDALSRRRFLQAAGALIVSATPLAQSIAATVGASAPKPLPLPGELDSWIAILPDGSVTAFFGKMDMGHGLEVAIAQIVADELDVGVDQVTVLMGDTATTCNQGGASGSTGVSNGARPLRNAAAEARRILVEAAATHLNVRVDQLEVNRGAITAVGNSGKHTSYAELIGGKRFNAPVEWNKAVGNTMDIKVAAKPKSPDQYRVVGKSFPRRDVAGKVLGTMEFVTDVRVPGMLHARVIRPPTAGATLGGVNEKSISAMRGVRVVREQNFLAVVADDEWQAIQAAQKLEAQWTANNDHSWPGSQQLHDHIRKAPVLKRDDSARTGDVDAAFATAARVVEADYDWPFQSHASMGPACAVADVRKDGVTVWTGSQKPHFVRDGVAGLLNLPPEQVRAIWVRGPGSYGRNDAGDAALDAAYLSMKVGRPVRVQGMRADGTGWDPKSPAMVMHGRAALDASGKVLGYEFTAKGVSRTDIANNEADPSHSLVGMAIGLPLKPEPALGTPAESYGFAAKRYVWETIAPMQDRYSPLRTSHLRDPVGPEIHFGSEQFIDEVAFAVGQDPVAFRLQHVKDARDAAVIRAAADKAQWQPRSTPRGTLRNGVMTGRGISYSQRGGTIVAVIAEVEVNPATGRVRARKFTVAHDCGLIISPNDLHQAIEGNVVQGLSRTLFEEVQFDAQTVKSVDWATYPILEIQDTPEAIDVVLINHPEIAPTGAGEPTIRSVPAAIANAFFDATGVRMRRVPMTPERVKALLSRSKQA